MNTKHHRPSMDESNLTGESQAVGKDAVRCPALFSGSKVLEGLGRMLVTAVGTHSQQGMIMALTTGQGDEDSLGLRCGCVWCSRANACNKAAPVNKAQALICTRLHLFAQANGCPAL